VNASEPNGGAWHARGQSFESPYLRPFPSVLNIGTAVATRNNRDRNADEAAPLGEKCQLGHRLTLKRRVREDGGASALTERDPPYGLGQDIGVGRETLRVLLGE
jgi:hypothetical protein